MGKRPYEWPQLSYMNLDLVVLESNKSWLLCRGLDLVCYRIEEEMADNRRSVYALMLIPVRKRGRWAIQTYLV
jgi:hypothetical protein